MSGNDKMAQSELKKQIKFRRKSEGIDEKSGNDASNEVSEAFLRNAGPDPAVATSTLADADPATRAQVVNRLQEERGNAYVQRVVANSTAVNQQGAAGQEEIARAEQATGHDLSGVQVIPDSPLAGQTGVEALTVGTEVHFAAGQYHPDTEHGALVLGHELAHVVQQGSGLTGDIEREGRYEQLEREAESTTARIAKAAPSHSRRNPLTAPARPAAQAFDPRYHRQALAEGLVGTGFTNEEIGKIYAANWERDFSQGHPAFAAIVLTWKDVKIAAHAGSLTEEKIKKFEGTVSTLVDMIPLQVGELFSAESYGGYRYFEHMDNPGMDISTPSMKRRKPESIPPYVVDAREFIKAQLYRAAASYRGDMQGTKSSKPADDFAVREKELKDKLPHGPILGGAPKAEAAGAEAAIRASRPHGGPQSADLPTSGPVFHTEVDRRFWERTHYKVGRRLDSNLPEDKPYVRTWLRIRNEVRAERQVQVINRPPETVPAQVPPMQARKWGSAVPDALGSASHSLEDFFAHSNFVDLAIPDPWKARQSDHTDQLITGTFGKSDKNHAISRKIRAAADEIEREMPLVNRVAGRTTENPRPDEVHIASDEGPIEQRDEAPKSWLGALGGTGLKAAGTVLGYTLGGLGAGAAAGGLLGSLLGPVGGVLGSIAGGVFGVIKGLRAGIRSAARNVLVTDKGAQMLRRVAEYMENDALKKGDPGSHREIAKDQPAHESNTAQGRVLEIKYQMAQALASTADSMVFGLMQQVFNAPTAVDASNLLKQAYDLLDKIIVPNSEDHPLAAVVSRFQAEAEKAYKELHAAEQAVARQ